MKSVLLKISAVLLAIISIGLILYPFVSNYLMGLNQQSAVETYEAEIKNTDDNLIQAAINEAREYNKSLYGRVVLTDPFDPAASTVTDREYESLLNLSGNSVMASIEIPCIDLNLPIYHGTSDENLKKGAGHLRQTSLPVGGKGTHCVITGHTGLSSASLFTDINLLKNDDIVLVHCYNETLAYKVDQIKVVLPDDTDDLKINPEKDYLTLVTCTPYGVNTHRLLVRGERTEYTEDSMPAIESRAAESTWMKEYKRAVFIGAIASAVTLVVFFVVRHIKKSGKINNCFLEATNLLPLFQLPVN